jgi:hypothetical protein
MDGIPTSGAEGANTPGAASGDEARQFHAFLQRHKPLPADVHRIEFRFGEDSTGAPAVWIVVVTHDDLNPSEEHLATIRRLAEDVRADIFRSGSDRWPYIGIEVE